MPSKSSRRLDKVANKKLKAETGYSKSATAGNTLRKQRTDPDRDSKKQRKLERARAVHRKAEPDDDEEEDWDGGDENEE